MNSSALQIGFDRFIQLDWAAAALNIRADTAGLDDLNALLAKAGLSLEAKKKTRTVLNRLWLEPRASLVEFADRGTLVPRADLAKEVATRCHAQGILVLTCGTYSNVIRLLPPLVIDESLLRDGLTVLHDVIQQVDAAQLRASRQTVAA